jgi:hypothetical protein
MGLTNSSIQCLRLSGLWLKKIAKMFGIPAAKILHHLTSLIRGIVVHDQDFPPEGLR